MAFSGIPFDIFAQNASNFTKVYHHTPYDTISVSRQELSQVGKTVLITGGATGIGRSIATNFLRAGVSTIVITGRRKDILETGAEYLRDEARKLGTSLTVTAQVSDQSDRAAVKELWLKLQRDAISVDILVLNAADFTEQKPILELGVDRLWAAFETNVRGAFDMVESFWKQPDDKPKVS
jgi:NAD(P)-dependent dehydrogenase (short-subunit alcohol dehydrogenase family)